MAKKKVQQVLPDIIENIDPTTLDELMGDRFGIYAKDVIQDRAIPDARDGMKPVQRRIIYAMWKTGNTVDKPTKKCAHIVGEVMGKYHPHGDSSIYEALVRMSQPWNVRLPLVDFQGNNGSMDGDSAAAYRYTEARLAAVSQELIRDIEKDTVDMELTFDDTEFEPSVLPAHFPNLFVNGAKGIAVGLATEIPTHNLREIVAAVVYRLNHPDCDVEKLMEFVPGPDFPTGGIIYQSSGLQDIYKTGRGRIEICSKAEIVESKENGKQIIISAIPYQVTKSDLVKEIDQIRHSKTIAGIEEVRDETDANVRIAIDLKDDAKPESILAYLLAKTQMRVNYSANIVAIVNGSPKTLNLPDYCDTYIEHQRSVVTRRCVYELKKDEARLLIVDGLIKANSIINEVVEVIRHSKDKADSKVNLEKRFGFVPEQSEAIVMMPLYKLSHTDIDTLIAEKKALEEDIAELHSILEDPKKRDLVIEKDLKRIAKLYGDERKTSIEEDDKSLRTFNKRDLVKREEVYVVATRDGYLKRSTLPSWKGSGGQNGVLPGLKQGDTVICSCQCQTTDFMVFFTSKGNYLFVPVHLLKANKWLEEGQHVNIAISLDPDDKLVNGFAVRHFRDDLFFVMLTRKGQIKRVRLSDFRVARYSRPIRAMKILSDDQVVSVCLTSGNSNLIVFSEDGKAVAYNENELPIATTFSSGSKAAKFKGSECACLLSFYPEEKDKILLLTQYAHTRVLESSKIVPGKRLGPFTEVFRSFKSEPHSLVLAEKTFKSEPPVEEICVLANGENYPVSWNDFYVTPIEKYAKKTDNKLQKKNPIVTVHQAGGGLIDDTVKSLPLPVVENSEEEANSESEESANSLFEKSGPTEKFEQISIFDDDFE